MWPIYWTVSMSADSWNETDIWIHHIMLTVCCVYCSDLLRLQILHVPLSTRRSGKTHQALRQSSVVVLSLFLCLSLSHTHTHAHTQTALTSSDNFRHQSFKKKTFSVLFSVHINVWFKNEVGGNAVIFTFSQIYFQARARDSSAIQV